MKNASFMLRSKTDKREAIANTILHRTNKCLSEEQMRQLMLTLRDDRQYEVTIHTDASSFCDAIVLVETDGRLDTGTMVFGRALLGRARDDSYQAATMFDANEAAAAVVYRRIPMPGMTKYKNALHLYIPAKMFAKGAAPYARTKAQYGL